MAFPAVVRVTPEAITGFPARNELGAVFQLNFTNTDCTGTAYVRGTSLATFGGRAILWDGNLHIPKPEPGVDTTINQGIILRSRVEQDANQDLICVADTFQSVYTEAITVPLTIFDVLAPPFSIEGLRSFLSP